MALQLLRLHSEKDAQSSIHCGCTLIWLMQATYSGLRASLLDVILALFQRLQR